MVTQLNTIKPESPDRYLGASTKLGEYGQAANARLAHVNIVVDKVNEIIQNMVTTSDGYQGLIDAADPCPIATKGMYWKVDTGGQFATNGPIVESGDEILCIANNTATGTWEAKGSSFMILERNINVGVKPTPVVRTNNPIVSTDPIQDNISALDNAIGLTPVNSNYIVPGDTIGENLDALDAALDVVEVALAAAVLDSHTVAILGATTTGIVDLAPATTAKLERKVISTIYTIPAPGSAALSIGVGVPAGAKLIGAAIRNQTAIVLSGVEVSYGVAYSGGATQTIKATMDLTSDAHGKTFFNTNAATDIASNTVDVTITAAGADTFTSGTIEVVIWYEELGNIIFVP